MKSYTTVLLALLLATTGTSIYGQTPPDWQMGHHRIGVVCAPPGPALRTQLQLPLNTGLLVDVVFKGSPAEKAGLRRYDIITKAGNIVIKSFSDLQKATADTSDKEIILEILRHGKKQSISIIQNEGSMPPAIMPLQQMKRYVVGISVNKVEPEQIQKLKLPVKTGWIVNAVEPDGPADIAGIKPNDILVEAQSKPLVTHNDLTQIITECEGKKIELKLFRNGTPMTLSVIPEATLIPFFPMGSDMSHIAGDEKELQAWLEKIMQGNADGRFVIIHPPILNQPPPLPSNLTITITKSGQAPSEIVVKRGDQTWSVTETTLDKLPEDIRVHVRVMLENKLAPGPNESPGNMILDHSIISTEEDLKNVIRKIEDRLKDLESRLNKPN